MADGCSAAVFVIAGPLPLLFPFRVFPLLAFVAVGVVDDPLAVSFAVFEFALAEMLGHGRLLVKVVQQPQSAPLPIALDEVAVAPPPVDTAQQLFHLESQLRHFERAPSRGVAASV